MDSKKIIRPGKYIIDQKIYYTDEEVENYLSLVE
jgi:hypothetical protein